MGKIAEVNIIGHGLLKEYYLKRHIAEIVTLLFKATLKMDIVIYEWHMHGGCD